MTRAVFLAVLLVYSVTAWPGPCVHQEHALQASMWLNGHTWIDPVAGAVWEKLRLNGHWFEVAHPPLSAFVMVPGLILGIGQGTMARIIAAFDAALVWRLVTRSQATPTLPSPWSGGGSSECWLLGWGGDPISPPDQGEIKRGLSAAVYLTLLFAFGTTVWFEASRGWPWGFCLLLSCAPSLLALAELGGCRRAWLVGVWAGLAALARYDLVAVWPVYWWVLKRRHVTGPGREVRRIRLCRLSPLARNVRQRRRHAGQGDPVRGETTGPRETASAFLFWGPCLGAVAVYVGYAWVRFGTWHDPTLWLWWAQDGSRGISAGPFSLRNLPLGIFTAVFMAPGFQGAFPWLRPSAMGQSIVSMSPALLLAFRGADAGFLARQPRAGMTNGTLLLCVVLSMGGALCVYSNGVEQLGARYWIQAYPFLLTLMARNWRGTSWERGLVGLSILLSGGQMWIVRRYGWA